MAEESILEEAQRIIHGQRNKDYGHPRENFAAIAALWNAYIMHKDEPVLLLQDVANMMILLKVARLNNGVYHRDSVTDIAGYAGTIERLQEVDSDEGQLSLSDVGQMIRDSWGRQDLDITIEVSEPELVAGFEELQAQIPRVWQSLADVPHDVRVGDKEGDVWIYYDGPRDGWGWRGRPSPLHPDDYPGPFIEILG